MVQRDANCVYSMNSKVNVYGAAYMRPNSTLDEADILTASMPFPVAISMMVGVAQT